MTILLLRRGRFLPALLAAHWLLSATFAAGQWIERLPPVAAGASSVQRAVPASRAQPAHHASMPPGEGRLVSAEMVSANRVVELEQRIAELESRLTKGLADESGNKKEPAKEKESEGYIVGSDLSMKASWRNGLEIISPHKDFRVHIGGRTQIDTVFLEGDPQFFAGTGGAGDGDGVAVRRGRFRIDGTMYEFLDWAVELDFFNTVNDNVGLQPASEAAGNVANVPAPTDVWWDVKELPLVGHFRFGIMKEPIGLEHQNSSRFLDFMERSFNQDAFTGPFNNGFTPGMMFWDTLENKRFHWAAGVFKNGNNAFGFDTGDGEYAVDGRLGWLVYYDEPAEGRYLVHLGVSASHRDLDEDRIRFRSRASLRNGPGTLNPVLADTGTFFGDDQSLGGLEAAVVYGPLLVQAEYIASVVTDPVLANVPQDTYFSQGYYVQALYFLTGEHRAYDFERFSFTRVVPYDNAYLTMGRHGLCHGKGAWQVGIRYAQLDLSDEGIDGGIVQDVTLGLNWFLNPNMKVQWNYVYMDRDAPYGGPDGQTHGFGMRVAHDY